MTPLSSAVRHTADIVGRVFHRLAALIVGFVLMVAGVGMTASIVMVPAGVVLGLLGVLIFLGGLFAPADRATPQGDR